MPRLNHGTLLENLVVLEVTRVLAAAPETTVEFASAFAMPPLTRCWHRTQDEPRSHPRFNANVMANLLNGALQAGDPLSYSALLLDCLLNAPNLPVVPYALQDAAHLYPFGGPNGALLAALLRRRHGQAIRIWSNDLVGSEARYHGAPAPNAATECPLTNEYADALVAGNGGAVGVDAFCDLGFPASVPAMAAWRGSCMARIGFLDPDSYVADGIPAPEGQVDSLTHVYWLTNLHHNALCTAGLMFFAHQMKGRRLALIAAFHNDAVVDFPHSVVFGHGIYMVGVKLRSHGVDPMPLIIAGVRDSWAAWSAIVHRRPDGLCWYVDGQA